MDEDEVSTLNVGDRFLFQDSWFTVIGIYNHPHAPGWKQIAVKERALKPINLPGTRTIAIRRANGGSEY